MNTLLKNICLFVVIRVLLITAGLAAPITSSVNKRLSLIGYLTVAGYALIGILAVVAPMRLDNYTEDCYWVQTANQYPELDAKTIPAKQLPNFLKAYAEMRPVWDGQQVTAATTEAWIEQHGFVCEESRMGTDGDMARFKCDDRAAFEKFLQDYGKMVTQYYLRNCM
jgi:hypothetical protein